jgi:hypothetical protein
LALLSGVLIYPSYNVLVRKTPIGVLEATNRWAVGLFEIKEHLGTLALIAAGIYLVGRQTTEYILH